MYKHKYLWKTELFSFVTESRTIYNIVNISNTPYGKSIERYYDYQYKYLLPWSTIDNQFLIIGHPLIRKEKGSLLLHEHQQDIRNSSFNGSIFTTELTCAVNMMIKNYRKYHDDVHGRYSDVYKIFSHQLYEYLKKIESKSLMFRQLSLFLTPEDFIRIHDYLLIEIPSCFNNKEFKGHARSEKSSYLRKFDYRDPNRMKDLIHNVY